MLNSLFHAGLISTDYLRSIDGHEHYFYYCLWPCGKTQWAENKCRIYNHIFSVEFCQHIVCVHNSVIMHLKGDKILAKHPKISFNNFNNKCYQIHKIHKAISGCSIYINCATAFFAQYRLKH